MIFQPAVEEIGGAKKIINEKPDLFNKASFLFGFHIWNQIETGKIEINNETVFVHTDKEGKKQLRNYNIKGLCQTFFGVKPNCRF